MTDELAARRQQRDETDEREAENEAVASLRGEPLRIAMAEHIEKQDALIDRVLPELKRLGNGCVELRDRWAASGNKSLIEAAGRLDDLLCGRNGFAP
jgi:hypothetical protein